MLEQLICQHSDLYHRFAAVLENSDFLPRLENGKPIAVACSGGADSLALSLLLKHWCNENKREMIALIVDHGLRAESTKEAQQVSERLASVGIDSEVLSSKKAVDFSSNLQARLRDLRYDLLSSYCLEHDIYNLFLGHHSRDQAETFLLRLKRGSHIKGLGGMASVVSYAGGDLHLLRPLLSEDVFCLRSFVESSGLFIIDDPSNDSDIFDRVRMRKLLPILSDYGLGVDVLSSVSARLRLADDFIESESLRYIREIRVHAAGYMSADRDLWRGVHPLLHYILLSYIWRCLGVGDYPPRGRSFADLSDVIIGGGDISSRVLGGVMMFGRGDEVLFCREAKFMDCGFYDLFGLGGSFVWDGRFRVSFSGDIVGSGYVLGGCFDYDFGDFGVDLPLEVRRVLPFVYLDGGVCACPLVGFYKDNCLELKDSLKIEVIF